MSEKNVFVPGIKMVHTKELSHLQGLPFWTGSNMEEIVLCNECNGTGEIGHSEDICLVKICMICNSTGRKK
jgi:hypothetical protein